MIKSTRFKANWSIGSAAWKGNKWTRAQGRRRKVHRAHVGARLGSHREIVSDSGNYGNRVRGEQANAVDALYRFPEHANLSSIYRWLRQVHTMNCLQLGGGGGSKSRSRTHKCRESRDNLIELANINTPICSPFIFGNGQSIMLEKVHQRRE